MRGLIVCAEPVELILLGRKTWEIRGQKTAPGPIALIQSGSSTVVGTADLVAVHGPLTAAELARTENKHRIAELQKGEFKDRKRRKSKRGGQDGLPYPMTYAWELGNVKRLKKPVPYKHPYGAVIWVRLPDDLLD